MKIEFYCDLLKNVCMTEPPEDEVLNTYNAKSRTWIHCIYIYLVHVHAVNEWKVYGELSVQDKVVHVCTIYELGTVYLDLVDWI